MLKIIVNIACLLALVVLAAACGGTENTYTTTSTTPTIPLTTYENTAHGFSVGYPVGWTENVTDTGRDVTFSFNEVEGRLTTDVSVEYLSGDVVLSDYMSRILGYMSALPNYELISQGDVTISGDIPGHEIVFKAEYIGTLEKFRYVFLARGKQGIIVGARGEPGYFDQQKALIDAVIESFELLSTYTYIPPAASLGSTYTNAEYGFSVTYTEGWQEGPLGQHGGIIEFVYRGIMPIVTIGVSPINEGTTLAEVELQIIQGLIKVWGGYNLVSLGEIILDDGTPAYEMVMSGTMAGNKIKGKYVLVVQGTQAFVITGMDVPALFEQNEAVMDEVILSFHLK